MWNNGFGNSFPNFNPEDFQPLNFGGVPAAQFIPQQGTMQINESNGNDPMDGDYQPGLSFANQRSFMQNQDVGASFSTPPLMSDQTMYQIPAAVPSPRAPTQMNARAAELKAQLLKKKGERTPPVHAPVAPAKQTVQQTVQAESSTTNNPKPTDDKREQDLNELISQYSVPKPTNGTTIKQENKSAPGPKIEQMTAVQDTTKSQASDSRHTNPTIRSKPPVVEHMTHALSRQASRGSVSEGEIFDEPVQVRGVSAKQKESQPKETPSRPEESLPRRSRDDQSARPQPSRSREEFRYHSPSSSRRASVSNGRDDRHEHPDRMERRKNVADSTTRENNRYPESESRYGSRDEERRPANGAISRPEPNKILREPNPPSLQDILPLDADLREWLDITGYHNEPYRSKILNRRRAIAALDAQRDKLLAEMAAEERGGVPPSIVTQPTPSMLPPPIPNKVESRVEPNSTASVDEPPRASNKRPYSEFHGSKEASSTEERAIPSRIKNDPDSEYRRPRSGGQDHVRREGSEPPRQRFAPRPRSRERGSLSPGRRAYDGRPSARTREYESDHYFDRDDSDVRFPPPDYQGSYTGKNFDPDFRRGDDRSSFRGRGGRGRGRGEFREQRREYQGSSEHNNDSQFGSRIANGKPYRDVNGFNRGGRGDTRYFIVKSFNEDNVLRCIKDSIWTTQVQNGPLFKEAFETCKNVILVFSINKSRAFQGYARMESLPGSVEAPNWQKAINWESAGAFKVKWLVICTTRFHRVGHLKNSYNENQAVLIGKDGQEIEARCAAGLIEIIDDEAAQILGDRPFKTEDMDWENLY